jgi:hypothetical protein
MALWADTEGLRPGALFFSHQSGPKNEQAAAMTYLPLPTLLSPAREGPLTGYSVQISVDARPSQLQGSREFALLYQSYDGQNSGWRRFVLSPVETNYRFDFALPPSPVPQLEPPKIAIWADTDNHGAGLLLTRLRVTLRPLPPA